MDEKLRKLLLKDATINPSQKTQETSPITRPFSSQFAMYINIIIILGH